MGGLPRVNYALGCQTVQAVAPSSVDSIPRAGMFPFSMTGIPMTCKTRKPCAPSSMASISMTCQSKEAVLSVLWLATQDRAHTGETG